MIKYFVDVINVKISDSMLFVSKNEDKNDIF